MDSLSATDHRSTFVTALAWILIVFSGFSVFGGIAQNVVLHLVMPTSEMEPAISEAAMGGQIPPFAEFMLSNFRAVSLGLLVLSLVTLGSSIGLLRRLNWARLLTVGLMLLTIFGNIGGFILQITMSGEMSLGTGVEMPGHFKIFRNVQLVLPALMALAFSGLCGFVIFKLNSERIRREFT